MLMGHASPHTTAGYVASSRDKAVKAVSACEVDQRKMIGECLGHGRPRGRPPATRAYDQEKAAEMVAAL